MSFEGYVARFDRAVRVSNGKAVEVELMKPGQTVLAAGKGKPSMPVVMVPVALSGIARPGQAMTVVPGSYSGKPAPTVTCRLYRDGREDTGFGGSSFAVTEADLGRVLKVVETARNPGGTVATEAQISVERVAPTAIELSVAAAAVETGAELPMVLASMTGDGDKPLTWALSGEAGHLALEADGGSAVLRLVSMPAPGEWPAQIELSNAAGRVRADFDLSVRLPAAVAPRAVVTSRTALEVPQDAPLPIDLAELAADGTAPLFWQVTGGGADVVIDTDGAVPVLRLLTMPMAGLRDLVISASNEAGTAASVFALTVTPVVVTPVIEAPQVVTLSAAAAEVTADAALPLDLAVLSADGTAPLEWSVTSGDWAEIDVTGTDPVLRLVAMPEAGQQAITLRAANEAGAAEAGFALTVKPAVVTPVIEAPQVVTLSAAAAEVMADAALPLDLSTLSADGTAPLEWSVTSGDWAEIDVTGTEPVLRLVAMPEAGQQAITLRAANEAGAAEAGFALTVTPVVVAGPGYSASSGAIAVGPVAADGSRVLTISGGDYPGSYVLTAAQVAALEGTGHAVMLVAPTLTQSDETFAIASHGLYAMPVDDPVVITHDWLLDGRPSGGAGDSYTRTGSDRFAAGTLRLRYTNVAMEAAGATGSAVIDVWSAPQMTLAPMHFRSSQADHVEWTVSGVPDADKAAYYVRFQYLPDAGDTTRSANFFHFGEPFGVPINYMGVFGTSSRLRAHLNFTSATGARYFVYTETALPQPGDLIEVFAVMGVPVSDGDPRNSIRVNTYYNGVLQFSKVAAPPAGSVVNAAAFTQVLLGGKTVAGCDTMDLYRAAVWVGSTAKMDELIPLFRKSDGGLAHPGIAAAVLGTPLIDFYNGTNHGSLGAPATMSDLA